MTDQRTATLKELQGLDLRIKAKAQCIKDYDPKLAGVEEPAKELEGELARVHSRLGELRLEERRLTLNLEQNRERRKRLDERAASVRNLREEAAVSAETDMVNRALTNDEQEALAIYDQIRRLDDRATELATDSEEARAQVEPSVRELTEAREQAVRELELLKDERVALVERMDGQQFRLYEGISRGGRGLAVADLTDDGACGHCYGIIPLQDRHHVLSGAGTVRCEACGVIVTAPDQL